MGDPDGNFQPVAKCSSILRPLFDLIAQFSLHFLGHGCYSNKFIMPQIRTISHNEPWYIKKVVLFFYYHFRFFFTIKWYEFNSQYILKWYEFNSQYILKWYEFNYQYIPFVVGPSWHVSVTTRVGAATSQLVCSSSDDDNTEVLIYTPTVLFSKCLWNIFTGNVQ